MAIDEILRETVRGAVRAEKAGPSGWKPCPLRKFNKRFLNTTINSVISHNKRTTDKRKCLRSNADNNKIKPPKFGQRKHTFQTPNDKSK